MLLNVMAKETVSFDKVSNRLNKLIQGDGNRRKL